MRYALLLLATVSIAVLGCSSVERPIALGEAPGAPAPTHCPQCGGALARVSTVSDDPEKPSKNLAVWNRSICGNLFYGPDSLVCTNCWLAYCKPFDRWERSSELPDSFRRPLRAAIRECPLPRPEEVKSTVVYSQEVGTHGVRESVTFWCADSAELISRLGEFARGRGLLFRVEERGRIADRVYIVVETKPAA